MKIRPGIGVGSGYAIGPAFLVGREEYRIERRRIDKDVVDSEIERLEKAFDKALGDIEKPLKKYAARLGPEVSDILEAHMKLLSNEAMREEIRDTIRQECCGAENAFSNFIRQRVKKLAASGQVSFVQRLIQDLTELEKSVLRHLLGRKREDLSHLTKPVIIVANDLSPAETLRLDRRNILGMITEVGGRTSHTAIVAASLGIPAVVGVEAVTNEISGGDPLILDGGGGKVFIHPDEATQKRYTAMMLNFQFSGRKLTEELHDLPAETKDGHRITMLANIESPFEIESALRYRPTPSAP